MQKLRTRHAFTGDEAHLLQRHWIAKPDGHALEADAQSDTIGSTVDSVDHLVDNIRGP